MEFDFSKVYAKDERAEINTGYFKSMVYPSIQSWGVDLYFPNFEKAPWQIQCEINGAKVNIWPGSMKAHEEFTPIPAASGIREIIVLLYGLAEPTKEETFDVVE